MGVPDFVGHHGEETKEEYISTTALELAESSVLYIPLKEVMIRRNQTLAGLSKEASKEYLFIYLFFQILHPGNRREQEGIFQISGALGDRRLFMEIILETLYKTLDCILQLDSIVNIGKLGPTPHSSFYRRTCPFMKGLFC